MGIWDFWRGQPNQQQSTLATTTPKLEEPRILDDVPPSSSKVATDAPKTESNEVELPFLAQNRGARLFVMGSVFFAISVFITRRALARRRLAKFTPTASAATAAESKAAPQTSAAIDALEAFNIATINVVSLAMMATGGTLWYLKINSTEDARRLFREKMGVSDMDDELAEEELQEWVALMMTRKEFKDMWAKAEAKVKEKKSQEGAEAVESTGEVDEKK